MKLDDITAIILTCDRPRMLSATLQSITAFKNKLVVSGGPAEADELAAAAGAEVRSAKLSRSTGGFSGLRNAALRFVRTPYAFFMDDDESMNPEVPLGWNLDDFGLFGAISRVDMMRPWEYRVAPTDMQIRLVHTSLRFERLLHETLGGLRDPGFQSKGRLLTGTILHWGWACKYAVAPRIESYGKVGHVPFDGEVDDVLRDMRSQPRAEVWPSQRGPVPDPVLEEWQ